eukprot:scaffold248300_cov24-Tisochrysis_lutea.AAC.2
MASDTHTHMVNPTQPGPVSPHLGRNIDEVVLGLPEARRAQAVAVQARAHLLAIAEHQQGGSVPALLNALPVL